MKYHREKGSQYHKESGWSTKGSGWSTIGRGVKYNMERGVEYQREWVKYHRERGEVQYGEGGGVP